MKLRNILFVPLLGFFSLNLHAGFFGNLFERADQKDIQITQEDPILEENIVYEEEIISADEYIDSVEEPTDIEVFSSEDDGSRAFDENELFTDEDGDENPFVRAQSIFLSYVEKPKKIYLSQHAIVKVKAVVTQENISAIHSTFLNQKNISILNEKNPWKKSSNNSYENSYTLKAFSTSVTLPDIKTTTESSNGNRQSETLKAYQPKIVALREDKEFCLVLSQDLTLLSHHEKKYDEKSNIVVMEINASYANLEDFHIPYAIRDGIDEIKYNGHNQTIYYFAIIPNDIKLFKFKYFDLVSNKYNIVSFPVVLQDSSVSTQTDLNPEESRFALYKAIALIVLAFIIFLFYLKSRKLYLLILALVVIAFLFYIRMPISKIVLQKDIKLRILPTQNSTVFYTTEKTIQADILLKKGGYIKVLLPNKKIGWIDEDLTKN